MKGLLHEMCYLEMESGAAQVCTQAGVEVVVVVPAGKSTAKDK